MTILEDSHKNKHNCNNEYYLKNEGYLKHKDDCIKLAICWSLFITCLLHATCYLLPVTCYMLLIITPNPNISEACNFLQKNCFLSLLQCDSLLFDIVGEMCASSRCQCFKTQLNFWPGKHLAPSFLGDHINWNENALKRRRGIKIVA